MAAFSMADLARLSRISLSPEQAEMFSKDLERIIVLVDAVRGASQLNHLPPESMNHADTVSRPDIAGSCLDRAKVLAGSPLANAGYIKVPKVFE